MALPKVILPTLLGLLTIDALIEVGFIGSMVGYLHTANHDIAYQIAATSSNPQFPLYPKPAQLLLNQGHTSNGAAGTALILVSWLGLLVLHLERRGRRRSGRLYKQVRTTSDAEGNTHTMKTRTLPSSFGWLYPTWAVFSVLSFLLTLSALIYTFVVTSQTDARHSRIDSRVAVAAGGVQSASHAGVQSYPDDTWTPENWYTAVLRLTFVDESLKGDIRTHVKLMEGWRWNLIPLFLLGFAIMVIAVLGWMEKRREGRGQKVSEMVQEKHVGTSLES